jgi:septal ring factor EnvC (AmiA/AmiB activator)
MTLVNTTRYTKRLWAKAQAQWAHAWDDDMSFENQLGSVAARLRQIESQIVAMEHDLAIEKDKLTQALADLKVIQSELRPKS